MQVSSWHRARGYTTVKLLLRCPCRRSKWGPIVWSWSHYGTAERGGDDTDDSRPLIAERELLPQYVCITAEFRSPESFADQYDPRRPNPVFVRPERPAGHEWGPEQRKVARRYTSPTYPLAGAANRENAAGHRQG